MEQVQFCFPFPTPPHFPNFSSEFRMASRYFIPCKWVGFWVMMINHLNWELLPPIGAYSFPMNSLIHANWFSLWSTQTIPAFSKFLMFPSTFLTHLKEVDASVKWLWGQQLLTGLLWSCLLHSKLFSLSSVITFFRCCWFSTLSIISVMVFNHCKLVCSGNFKSYCYKSGINSTYIYLLINFWEKIVPI